MDSLLELDEYDFGTSSNGNILDDFVTLVVPEPIFKPKLFPGDSSEGDIFKLIIKGDHSPLLYVGDPGEIWRSISH
jgi:hypothetical protein